MGYTKKVNTLVSRALPEFKCLGHLNPGSAPNTSAFKPIININQNNIYIGS